MRHQVGSRPIYLSLRPWAHKRSRPCRRTGMLLHAIPRTPGNPENHLENMFHNWFSNSPSEGIQRSLILLFDRYFQVVVLRNCTIALCTWRTLPCRTNLLLHTIPGTPGNPTYYVQNTFYIHCRFQMLISIFMLSSCSLLHMKEGTDPSEMTLEKFTVQISYRTQMSKISLCV